MLLQATSISYVCVSLIPGRNVKFLLEICLSGRSFGSHLLERGAKTTCFIIAPQSCKKGQICDLVVKTPLGACTPYQSHCFRVSSLGCGACWRTLWETAPWWLSYVPSAFVGYLDWVSDSELCHNQASPGVVAFEGHGPEGALSSLSLSTSTSTSLPFHSLLSLPVILTLN